jgi:hypothetical protein
VETKTLDDAVQDALDGKSSVVLCPAHADSSPSLSVSPGTTQPVLLHCHAGCEPDAIIELGGLDWATVCAPLDETARVVGEWTPRGTASAVYRYVNAEGEVQFEVLRVPLADGKKTIMQRRPDSHSKSGYTWNLDGVVRVLYRLPEVIAAVAGGHTIHVAEGEKCADALQAVIPEGDVATTNPGGAGKWLTQFSEMLAGASVVVYADGDEPGRVHARDVRNGCVAEGCTVKVLEAPSGVIARSGKAINDVADHLEAGLGLDQLLETTPEAAVERARTGIDLLDLVKRPKGLVEFVIDDTLAKGERLILIGFEGTGKSTLCRQIAVQVAAGIHPFTGMAMKEPKKVLFIDAENHPDQTLESWQQLTGLCARHEMPVARGQLTVLEEWSGHPDLASPEGSAWLVERVHAYRPDLVVMGPLTNLADRDLRDDEPVRRIRNAVDAARTICNSAFIMEHHAPLKDGMSKERPLRPYGSSLFLKWPDYGYGIKPTSDEKVFEWFKNRGPRVRSREWPLALREGRPNTLEFPWMSSLLPEDMEP